MKNLGTFGNAPIARLDVLSAIVILPGRLDNSVSSSHIRLLLLVYHCTWLTHVTRLGRVICAVTVRKRTARVKPLLSVSSAVLRVTLTSMLLSISPGHRSWCLLHRDAPRCKPLRFSQGFMTAQCLCVQSAPTPAPAPLCRQPAHPAYPRAAGHAAAACHNSRRRTTAILHPTSSSLDQ